ncbi:MAG: YggT family protein [Actinomycetia bacterium]|nr:YggT family protein [Actinomycetes bacterium]
MKLINVLIDVIFWLLYFSIIARVIFSWIPFYRRGFIKIIEDFVYEVTEPILGFFRRLIPSVSAGNIGFDLSPLIALIVIQIVHNFIKRII